MGAVPHSSQPARPGNGIAAVVFREQSQSVRVSVSQHEVAIQRGTSLREEEGRGRKDP